MDAFRRPSELKIKDQTTIEWKKWRKTFETYMAAAGYDGKPDARKIAILLNMIGEDASEIHENFVFSETEDPLSYDIIIQKFEDFCLPQQNLVVDRYEFFDIKQGEGEPFDTFLTRLRTAASSCKFGDQLDWLIPDRIVHCIWDRGFQGKLLRTDPNITLAKTIEICRTLETTQATVSHILDRRSKIKVESVTLENNASQDVTLVKRDVTLFRECVDCIVGGVLPDADLKPPVDNQTTILANIPKKP